MKHIWENTNTEEIVNCKDCNKTFWKYWHIPIKDKFKRTVYPLMERCAPCTFKHERNKNY